MDEDRKRLRLIWSHENRTDKIVGWLQVLLSIVAAVVGFGFLIVGAVKAEAILTFVVALFMLVTGIGTLKRKF